jgi:tRNA (guanine-N7-)-methyltransferase
MKESYQTLVADRQRVLRAELETALQSASEFVCEIGCGHGHFLTAFAAANPDRLCIGVDLVEERIERALRKRERSRLTNLHFLRAEARLFFDTIPAGVGVSTLFLLFPDPWPKLRHHKHRIIQPDFLASVAARATADCRLYFRTDYQPYFAAAAATIAGHARWRILDEPWLFEYATVFQQRADSFSSLVGALRHPEDGQQAATGSVS